MILEKKFHLFFKKSNFDGGHGLFMDRSERLRRVSSGGQGQFMERSVRSNGGQGLLMERP